MESRSKRILSLLDLEPKEIGNSIPRKKKMKNRDIPDYVAMFDKGEWDSLDKTLRTPIFEVNKGKGDREKCEDRNKLPSLKVSENVTEEVEVIDWDDYCKRINGCSPYQEQSSELVKENVLDDSRTGKEREEMEKILETADICETNKNEDKFGCGSENYHYANTCTVGLVDEVAELNLITSCSKEQSCKIVEKIVIVPSKIEEGCKEVEKSKRGDSVEETKFGSKSEHIAKRPILLDKNAGESKVTESSVTTDESEAQSDSDEITIAQVSKHGNGKRYRNKQHCCKFCQKFFIAISRHIVSIHKEELEIAKVLALNSNERRSSLQQIVREGDYYYNKEVLATGKGELILVRRPTAFEIKTHTYQDYGPCTTCLGFMLKDNLWHHTKYGCKTVGSKPKSSFSVKLGCEALLAAGLRSTYSDDFEQWVIGKLSEDEVGLACKTETVILQYGDFLFQKYQTTSSQQRGQNVRSAMRSLITLYLKLKEKLALNSFLDLLDPIKFDLIVGTVQEMCQFQNVSKMGDLKSPSSAIRLGLELVKIGEFVRGLCLKHEDNLNEKKIKKFIHLISKEWSTRVSSTARSTLEQRKFNSAQLLPLTSDLIKLGAHLDETCENSKIKLEKGTNPSAYRRLCEALLSRIILFNKRRSGESSRMKVSDFLNRGAWAEETTEELKKSMSEMEKQLANKLVLVYTKGKRKDKVPVLLTDKMKGYVELLIGVRLVHGIEQENDFIFARPYPAETPLRGHDCLKKSCIDAGLTSYERISGTKLRKYVATVCQVFNLSENETDWLAKHLGHDLHVHREFYRLHESAVELTKVSRLLLAVDQGKVNKFAGRSLDDIDINEMSDIEEEVENNDQALPDTEETSENGELQNFDLEALTVQKKNQVSTEDEDYIPEEDEESENDIIMPVRNKKPKYQKAGRMCHKKPWSSAEKTAVLKFFRKTISERKGVQKIFADECIKLHPVLSGRTWLNVRDFVRNYIRKL